MVEVTDRKYITRHKNAILAASRKFGVGAKVSKDALKVFVDTYESADGKKPTFLFADPYKVDKYTYKLPVIEEVLYMVDETDTSETVPTPTPENVVPSTTDLMADGSLVDRVVPDKFKGYVRWGFFNDLSDVIKSGMFFPVFITGESGNGKTLMASEVCSDLGREMIRTNITIETDEDDLIGGFRLVNGKTVFHPGPVLQAMERGAILLLDEIDLASNKIMCLQSILEGNGYFVKKINRLILPRPGFNVIATANTKGKGSEDGRFMFTNVLNEAFLERFPITFEQDFPEAKVEKRIIRAAVRNLGINNEPYVNALVQWAGAIRGSYNDDEISELISTRRLVHIGKAFAIFKDEVKAVRSCVSRFDEHHRDAFMELFDKCWDAEVQRAAADNDEVADVVDSEATEKATSVKTEDDVEIPF